MNNNGFRTRGIFEFLAVIVLVAAVGIGVYFYQSVEMLKQKNTQSSNDQSDANSNSSGISHEKYEAAIQERSRFEGENAALKAARQQFDNEKNIILNQVRTSVKAFDDYRQQMSGDIKRLNDQIASVESENLQLKDHLAKANVVDESVAAQWQGRINILEKKLIDSRETIENLNSEIEKRQDQKILIEAAKLHYNVGNFYFRNKEYKSAIDEYNKSLMYQPNDIDTHYNLAIVADEFLGDREMALPHYKKYLALLPEGTMSREVEERILDLELFETVLVGNKGGKSGFLEPRQASETKRLINS